VLDDAVEQGVLVRGVPVDRHWVAAEGLPEPAHGKRVSAVGVDDRYGGGEDLLAGQRVPLHVVAERYDGLAAIDLFVNRMREVAESVIWFDGLQVRRRSRPRSQEMQTLLAVDVPTLKIIEAAEFEVVIAEMGPLP
jgi:hypothetical protein